MQDLLYIDDTAVAAALLQPIRLHLVKRLGEARTCQELAGDLGVTTQQVNYHVKKLVEAGLVDRVEERRVRGTLEGIYQARARAYWLSASLVGRLGGEQALQEAGLSFLLSLAEDLQEDVAALAGQRDQPACMGISLHLELEEPERRGEFLEEVQEMLKALAAKYGGEGGGRSRSYKLLLACYEDPKDEKSAEQ